MCILIFFFLQFSDYLGSRLCKAWENELNESEELKKKQPSLLRAGFKVFGGEIGFLGLILFILEFGVRMSQPLFIGGLVNYYADTSEINKAYFYAGGVVLSSLLNVMITHPYM